MYDTLVTMALGLCLGFTLYWAGISNRKWVRSSLRLENLTVMKIMVYAVGYAVFLLALTTYMDCFSTETLALKKMSLAVVIGGMLFGLGLGMVGNCFSLSLAALPHGHKCKTFGIIAGSILGYYLYKLSHGYWQDTGVFSAWNLNEVTVYKMNESVASLLPYGYEGILFFSFIVMALAVEMPTHFRGK